MITILIQGFPSFTYDTLVAMDRTRWNSVSSVVLIVAILSSGLLHSAIPHSHTDVHDGHAHEHAPSNSISAIWASLHSALKHEDKYITVAATIDQSTSNAIFPGILTAIIILASTYAFRHRRALLLTHAISDRGDFLSNGIARYRRFA